MKKKKTKAQLALIVTLKEWEGHLYYYEDGLRRAKDRKDKEHIKSYCLLINQSIQEIIDIEEALILLDI